MTFETAIRTCLSNYATFTGRAPRSEFWWFYLFTVLVGIAALAADEALALDDLLPAVTNLVLLLPSLAAGARRLHDMGRSGWWLLLFLIPLIGLIVLIFWWVRPSEPYANAHGAPPLPPAA